jgi:predicted MFS family arabinose efflux permease
MIARTLSLYRVSFTGLSRETWLLSLIMLINRSGTMVVPFMTLYLTTSEMGHTLSEAGVVMGLFGAGAVVGAFFGGRASDRIGFYRVQVITLFCGGIMFIVLGQVKSYPFICLVTFLLAFVNEAFRPANSSAIAFYSKPANRTRSYSLNRLAINLGWALGTSAGGLIASVNYELLFWVDGFTNIGAAVLMLRALRPVLPVAKEVKESRLPSSNSAYRDKTYLLFIFYITCFAMCFFQLFTTIPKYFRDNLLLSEKYIGFLMSLNGLLIVAVEMVLVYKLEGKRNNLVFISSGLVFCALAFFSLLIPGNAIAITLLMIFFITLGEITSMPFMNSYWTSRSSEVNRGQYAALYTIAWGVAQALGPFLSAVLVDHSSFGVLFVAMGFLLLFTAFGFSRLYRAERASQHRSFNISPAPAAPE